MSTYDHSRVAHFIGACSPGRRGMSIKYSWRLTLGGNSIDTAPAGRVLDFVKANGGHTVITKVRSEHGGRDATRVATCGAQGRGTRSITAVELGACNGSYIHCACRLVV